MTAIISFFKSSTLTVDSVSLVSIYPGRVVDFDGEPCQFLNVCVDDTVYHDVADVMVM